MFLGKSQHYGRVHKPWWFLEQPKKSENYLKQRDFRICGFLRVFAGFCGLFAGFLRGFAGFIPSRLMRCKHFLAFVSPNPKTCNQSPKIQDLGVLGKISRYRSNSENTYIFLGFGGYCQTPSKIINGLKLLRASKSPAEHVGRLDMARLHITRNTPFTGSAELVILSQSNRCLCGQLRSYISQEFANFKSQ